MDRICNLQEFLTVERFDQGQLGGGVVGNAFHLVLAEHVDAEQGGNVLHSGRCAVALQHHRLFTLGSGNDVLGAVFRGDMDFDAPTGQVPGHDAFHALPGRRISGHQVEYIADEFDKGGLAGAPCADDAIELSVELEGEAVQESPADADFPEELR